MDKRIVLLFPLKSQYGVLFHFTRKLMEALRLRGVQANIVDWNPTAQEPEDFAAKIREQGAADYTLMFNGFLPDKWLASTRVPHITILVDPAPLTSGMSFHPSDIVASVDQQDCDYLRFNGCSQTLFLPHAVESDLVSNISNKEFDLVMLGTLWDPDSIRREWKERHPPEFAIVLDFAADSYLRDISLSIRSALTLGLEQCAIVADKEQFSDLFADLLHYIKAQDRFEMLKCFKHRKINLFGSIDQNVTKALREVGCELLLHNSLAFTDAIEVMKRAKIVLNSSPQIEYGGHERIFGAMAAGALVVTQRNPYLESYFKNGENILFSERGWNVDSSAYLIQCVDQLLKDEKRRINVAADAREIVMRHHTWDARAEHLLLELEKLKVKVE